MGVRRRSRMHRPMAAAPPTMAAPRIGPRTMAAPRNHPPPGPTRSAVRDRPAEGEPSLEALLRAIAERELPGLLDEATAEARNEVKRRLRDRLVDLMLAEAGGEAETGREAEAGG